MGKIKKRKGEKRSTGSGGGAAERGEWQGYQRHPAGLRQSAVQRMALGGNVSALARELGVHRNLLYYGRDHPLERPAAVGEWDRQGQQIRELEGRIAGLEGALGRKTQEADFFASALRRVEGRRRSSGSTGVPASTEKSGSGRKRRKAD